ncbi:hypothetical protein [Curtobacterium sp. MCSS17_008]|uniref:hypothetical protein n=1 Tax=Curtobacterium sp. MCSS17_008 TaxID=2175647 RepID=UPI0015E887EA|nr:hypothetical protein [Curtobacterium sp. MCSS17_008]
MSTYEADQRVQQVKITSYRNLRRAVRRGWVLPDGVVTPSLADLARLQGPGGGGRT